jgi:hypothetical protein
MAMPYPAYGASRPTPNNDYPSSSYPPNGPFNPSSVSTFQSTSKGADDIRNISRTPSPTPSEAKALSEGLISWKDVTNWRFWLRREWLSECLFVSCSSSAEPAIAYYIIIFVILVITALISIYHTQIGISLRLLPVVATLLTSEQLLL